MKAFQQKTALFAFMISLPIVISLSRPAIAAPKGCLSVRTIQALSQGQRGSFMLFDPSDRSPNKNGPINIREKPSVSASVLFVASSRNPVDILGQAEANDGYCWLKVKVTTDKSTAQSVVTVTGWVRGDLVTTGVD